MGPMCFPGADPIWAPYGLPIWAHIAGSGLKAVSPYGPHVFPGCRSHMGPIWAAHMGPISQPIWAPYGTHISLLAGQAFWLRLGVRVMCQGFVHCGFVESERERECGGGTVAQVGERSTGDREVPGTIPGGANVSRAKLDCHCAGGTSSSL